MSEQKLADLYVCLSEADQKRYECGPRLGVVLLDITAREQACVQVAFGYHTPEDILTAVRDMFGSEQPDGNVTWHRDANCMLALTWLGLRQNGYLKARRSEDMTAELADLDIQLTRAQLDSDTDAEGKDDADDSTPTRTSTT